MQTKGSKWNAATATCEEKAKATTPWKVCKEAHGVFNKQTKVCDTTNAEAFKACMQTKGSKWDSATATCTARTIEGTSTLAVVTTTGLALDVVG